MISCLLLLFCRARRRLGFASFSAGKPVGPVRRASPAPAPPSRRKPGAERGSSPSGERRFRHCRRVALAGAPPRFPAGSSICHRVCCRKAWLLLSPEGIVSPLFPAVNGEIVTFFSILSFSCRAAQIILEIFGFSSLFLKKCSKIALKSGQIFYRSGNLLLFIHPGKSNRFSPRRQGGKVPVPPLSLSHSNVG